MSVPPAVAICECFARDGLQNQDEFVPTDLKVGFIDAASAAGFVKQILGRVLNAHVVKTGLVTR